MKEFFNNSLILSFCFLSFLLKAQFNQQDLQPFGGADAAVSTLLGQGVQFSNAEFIGSKDQIGTFNNGFNKVGIDQGIIIATSNLTYPTLTRSDLNGTENPNSKPSGGLNNVDDPFINGSINDYASLSFEFIATSDLLEFEFVFASAEYPFFVFSNFNDKFVFVLTELNQFGGIVSESNIALLPGSNTVISINTVNNGSTNIQYDDLPAVNPNYFIESNNNWIYPGRTTVIPISQEINCGKRYKLRISICDIDDRWLDSAVFLKSASWNNENQVGEIQVPSGPFCEGEVITASVSGPSNALYEWSDGQSGIGLNSIQFTTNTTPSTISVNVTPLNTQNCNFFRTKNIVVHTSNNIPPYMNGINNEGIYDVYVRAGEFLEFQIPTFDEDNENVEFIWLASSSGNQLVNSIPSKDIGIFNWTPLYNQIGTYSIDAYCIDNNVCGALPSAAYTFNIHVICPYCEVGIDYANRFPNSNPVPTLTERAQYITAGVNGPVVIDQPTIFRAGESIVADVEFVSGGELFTELISVCNETVCDQCCETVNIDEPTLYFPVIFTPDGDGLNDIWHIYDLSNPYCAFNSRDVELYIYDQTGVLVFSKSVSSNECCAFKSPPAAFADILNPLSWNGTCNVSSFQTPPFGTLMPHSTYFYVYKIITCTGVLNGSGYVGLYGGTARYASQIEATSEETVVENKPFQAFEFLVFPNPSRDFLNNKIIENSLTLANYKVVLYDLTGRELVNLPVQNDLTTIDLTNFASGYYFLSLFNNNSVLMAQTKFIKQ